MKNLKVPRCAHRKSEVTGDWQADAMAGATLVRLAMLALPDAAATRRALLRLRQAHQFSRGQMAAILAVSLSVLRRWESGQRRPCAAARRVVQLVERLYFRPGDFPTEPLENVLSALMPDMADKLAELQQRA